MKDRDAKVARINRGYGVVAVDFDATIAEYTIWKGLGVFGEPIKGAKEALDRLCLKGYKVVINTTRGCDIKDVAEYLDKHHIPYHRINTNVAGLPDNISDKKVLADVYIDDRAIHFDGRWTGIVERVESFIPWYRRENARPSLNLMVAGYHVDQVSIGVNDIQKSIDEYDIIGHENWVIDTVQAKVIAVGHRLNPYDLAVDPDILFSEGDHFEVKLAFNYSMFPCEFELIQLLSGNTVQLPSIIDVDRPVLSHYGYHVNNLDEAITAFDKCGYQLMTIVETISHAGCPYRYRYAFLDTRILGFISKLIWRIPE